MKRFLTILFLLALCLPVFSQQSPGNDTSRYVWYKYNYGFRSTRYQADTVMSLPRDTMYSKSGIARIGSVLFVGNDVYWTAANTGGISVINIITDSSISICNFNSCDTFITSVTAQLVTILNDSTLQVCDTLNTCDTLHIPRTQFANSLFDTTTIYNILNQKLNIIDTVGMWQAQGIYLTNFLRINDSVTRYVFNFGDAYIEDTSRIALTQNNITQITNIINYIDSLAGNDTTFIRGPTVNGFPFAYSVIDPLSDNDTLHFYFPPNNISEDSVLITDVNGNLKQKLISGGTSIDTTSLSNRINLKQNLITLTTTGTSGASTFNQSTGALNIPQYAAGGGPADSAYFWSRLGNVINPSTDYLGTKTSNSLRIKTNNTLALTIDSVLATGATFEGRVTVKNSSGAYAHNANFGLNVSGRGLFTGNVEVNGAGVASTATSSIAGVGMGTSATYNGNATGNITASGAWIRPASSTTTPLFVGIDQSFAGANAGSRTSAIEFGYYEYSTNTIAVPITSLAPSTNITAGLIGESAGFTTGAAGGGTITYKAHRIYGNITDANSKTWTWIGSSIEPTMVSGAGTTTLRGYYYNPTLTSSPTTNIAFENTTGNNLFGTTSGRVGIGANTSINASSILDVTSTTGGFLPPRMTTTQRDAISSPAEGLIIYNLTTHKLNVYTTAWEQVTSL